MADKIAIMCTYDYLDGTEGVSHRQPGMWDETARLVDPSLAEAFDSAERALQRAGEALWKAYCDAEEIPNPLYVPDEDDVAS